MYGNYGNDPFGGNGAGGYNNQPGAYGNNGNLGWNTNGMDAAAGYGSNPFYQQQQQQGMMMNGQPSEMMNPYGGGANGYGMHQQMAGGYHQGGMMNHQPPMGGYGMSSQYSSATVNGYGNEMGMMGSQHGAAGASGLVSGGIASSSVMGIFRQLDRDGNGVITEQDFIILANNVGLGLKGSMAAKLAFRTFDRNRNGRLDFNEVMNALSVLQSSK